MTLFEPPSRVALIYVAIGSLWIIASDWLLLRILPDYLRPGQTVKGLVFVILSGAVIFYLVRREIAKRRRAQQEREHLRRRLAGAERLEAIGRLTGGIAHDFNNLLTAITGNISAYAQRRSEAGTPPSELEELTEADAAARRAELLIRQLLAFGRRQELTPRPLDLNRLIEGMGQLLYRLIGDQIDIETDLDPELGVIEVDHGRLQQVVMNLALNARDAMPHGGTLTLATRNVEIDDQAAARHFDFPIRPGHYVRLHVSDTGTGMDAATLEHIFEPFFTTKEKDVGTGLGMSTVYGVVKQSGGYITVASAPGEGSRFELYFPRGTGTVAEPSEAAPAPAEPPAGGGKRVLVVEDEEAVRSVIVRALERHGYTTFAYGDPRKALEHIDIDPSSFDLLLTDAVMPGLSGPELIRRARSTVPDVGVLLMSGYEGTELDGGAPYLAKPFTPAQLLGAIHDALHRAPDARTREP